MHRLTECTNAPSRRSGRRRFGAALLVGLTAHWIAVPDAIAAPDAQVLLARSDDIRNPAQPFRATVSLLEFEKGTQVGATTLQSHARTLEAGGQFVSILRFVLPQRDAGKVMLKNGSDLWFYDPSTKAAVRISPQQRLLGQAANGDVVTVNFARDYRASIAAEESVQDGERRSRRSYKLQLVASGTDATYGAIELWVDASTAAPIKARFFAESGRLLKTAYYRKFQEQLGAERPTETVIIDGLDPQSVTIVRMSEFAFKSLPLSWFQREQLARFSNE